MTAIPIPRRPAAASPAPARRRRGPSRIPAPATRILVYAPGLEAGGLGLALAQQLSALLPAAYVAVATDGADAAAGLPPSIRWHRLPDLRDANPDRPLARLHLEHQRRRQLSTLFDRVRPGILVAATEAAPPEELRELLDRASAFGGTTIFAVETGRSGDRCESGCALCAATVAAVLDEARGSLEP